MLSTLLIIFESKSSKIVSQQKTKRAPVTIAKNGKSNFLFERLNVIGNIIATIPKIKKMFDIFEPTTLPIATSVFPLIAPEIPTASSGRLVPIATIVSPITIDGTLSFFAIALAPDTKKSAPKTRKIKPKTKKSMFKKISIIVFYHIKQKKHRKMKNFYIFIAFAQASNHNKPHILCSHQI